MVRNPELFLRLTEILRSGGIEEPELEAKWMLEDVETEEQALTIAKKRAAHLPLQYLLGAWEFYGMRFFVGEGVLIPRADTETLVDAVLSRLHTTGETHSSAVDLCTGSGCIALALKAHCRGLSIDGLDISDKALFYAEKNARAYGSAVKMRKLDVCDTASAQQYKDLDVIVSNPPYLTESDMEALQTEVTYEPKEALDGGTDGLDFYRRIAALWKNSLRTGGMLVFEVGIHQAQAVEDILITEGFIKTERIPDLNGIERVVLGYLYG